MRRPRKSRRADSGTNGDHNVGYKRPPVSGRWKPGQSGNPSGHRKASKTVAQSIDETLTRRMTIEEEGRAVTLTLQELILRNLGYAAAHQDMSAIKILFSLKDRYQDSSATKLDPAELDPNDRAIIEGYLEKLQGAANTAGSQTSQPSEPPAADGDTGAGDLRPNQKSTDGELS
jgi:hypothetical protein